MIAFAKTVAFIPIALILGFYYIIEGRINILEMLIGD